MDQQGPQGLENLVLVLTKPIIRAIIKYNLKQRTKS